MLSPIRQFYIPELTDRLIDLVDQLQDALTTLDRNVPQSGTTTITLPNSDTETGTITFPMPYDVGTVVDLVAIANHKSVNVNLLGGQDHTHQDVRISTTDGTNQTWTVEVTWIAKPRV